MRPRRSLVCYRVIAAALMFVACDQGRDSTGYETVYSDQPATWFEDGWTHYEVSANGTQALLGGPFDFRLIDLTNGREDSVEYRGALDEVQSGTFDAEGRLVRWGTIGDTSGWYRDSAVGPQYLQIPPNAIPAWSPDGSTVAYHLWSDSSVFVATQEEEQLFEVEGEVTCLAWSPIGKGVYALAAQPDGLSTLLWMDLETGTVTIVETDLDAAPRFCSIGVATDGTKLYVALAGPQKPDPEDRHVPHADRDLDIYEFVSATGRLTRLVEQPGDDFHPVVFGDTLYWSHNELQDDVVVLPASGGEAVVVVEDAQIPYWGPDSKRLAFTIGPWRIADWALNLDAEFVGIDESGQKSSDPTPIVEGYHEDFTPAWSPDGSWIVYHSHRSSGPAVSYSGEGIADDLYVRRPSAPTEDEIRLTDFGFEVGVADWAPDGTRLVFDTWSHEEPGRSKPWIATIDTSSGRLRTVERLPLPDGVEGTLFAAWCPTDDGKIAFVEEIESGRQALWTTRTDGTQAQKLLEFESSTYGGLDWSTDGSKIVYSASVEGRMQLFAIQSTGGAPEQLSSDVESLIHPQVSPDGRWIAATRIIRANELQRMVLMRERQQ